MTEDVYQMFQAIIEARPTDLPEILVQGYAGFLFRDKNGMTEVAMHWKHRLTMQSKDTMIFSKCRCQTLHPMFVGIHIAAIWQRQQQLQRICLWYVTVYWKIVWRNGSRRFYATIKEDGHLYRLYSWSTSSLYRIDGDNYSGMGMYIPNSFTTPKYLLWNNYFKSSIAWYHASGWAETESIWGNWRRMQPVAFYLIPNNRYSGWKYRISGILPFPPSCLLHSAGLV